MSDRLHIQCIVESTSDAQCAKAASSCQPLQSLPPPTKAVKRSGLSTRGHRNPVDKQRTDNTVDVGSTFGVDPPSARKVVT